ncbi:MAG: DMT family transporter [Pseudomonadota bacterium]
MSQVRPREDRLGAAILIVLGAFLCFTLIDTMAKWLALAGIPVLQVAFLRYAGHAVSALAIFWPAEGSAVFRSNAPGLQLLRALFLLLGTIFNFVALAHLPLTVTIAIFFAAPIVVSLLAIPILGERIGLRRFGAILVGFAGILVIAAPWDASFHWALFFSFGALLCASLYFILTRAIAGVDDNPTGQVITSVLPTLALLPFVIHTWVWPDTATGWALAALIGVAATAGHSLLTVGYRYAPASTLAPVVYSQAIFAAAISWAVFAQPPDTQTLAGTAIIIGAGIYIWRRERALRQTPVPHPRTAS